MGFVDPYIDEEIGDLRNLLGAKSSEELKKLEPQIVFANELELEDLSIPRINDLGELLLIHQQLFKGVYEWAGKIRTVDIKKNDKASEYFLIVSKITDAAQYVFGELAKENALRNLSQDIFVKRLAYYYDQLDYIHPFREGNGRTQRVFWSRVAQDAGYNINWALIIGDENDEASRIAAEDMDLTKLEAMFTRIVSTLKPWTYASTEVCLLMSTYVYRAVNPETGTVQSAIFIDDFYGKHRYAVGFRKDGAPISIHDEIVVSEYMIYPREHIKTVPDGAKRDLNSQP